ncbi:Octanoyltransferase [Trinorchestia longiramus]|nr:Octanoyltransferase [Trinorchestia longiramus]
MSSQLAVRILKVSGAVDYTRAWAVQKRIAQGLADTVTEGQRPVHSLILLEHLPVYTVGLRSEVYNKEEELRLCQTGAQFVRSNRGGLITFHGPGQLTVYPILHLADMNRSLKWYVCALERAVIRTCQSFGVSAFTSADTGVWISETAKICAIGIQGRKVTTHGLALNCNTDLTWFDNIVPCGLSGKTVTSLTQELGREVCVAEAQAPFLHAFQEVFECSYLEEKLYSAKDFQLMSDDRAD